MIQLKRILCPLDLSSESGKALRYATALAHGYGATLCLCHCIEQATSATAAERNRIQQALNQLLEANCGLINPQKLRCEILILTGQPAHALAQAAAEQPADLIVMASRRRPIAAALLGSTTEAMCRTAACPVLVIHPHEREWVGQTSNQIALRRILIAYDFSTDSELALNYGVALAQEYQAEVHLLHVLPFAPLSMHEEMPLSEAAAFQQAAQRLQTTLTADIYLWCTVKHAVRSGQPYREILAYAEEHEIDLICLGVNGAGFAMRALFGSNTDRVLRQAPCPVLITRPLKPNLALPASLPRTSA